VSQARQALEKRERQAARDARAAQIGARILRFVAARVAHAPRV
jgi:hypothetical protein